MSIPPAEQLHAAVQHHIVNSLGWSALRALQEEAIEPVMGGDDALLLSPTAGGKTEAAFFPLLSRMDNEDWQGLSVLYVCPLRALLNNLEPRLAAYASWTARGAAARRHHGRGPQAHAGGPPRCPAHHPGVAGGDARLQPHHPERAVRGPARRRRRRGPRLRR